MDKFGIDGTKKNTIVQKIILIIVIFVVLFIIVVMSSILVQYKTTPIAVTPSTQQNTVAVVDQYKNMDIYKKSILKSMRIYGDNKSNYDIDLSLSDWVAYSMYFSNQHRQVSLILYNTNIRNTQITDTKNTHAKIMA